MITLFPVLKWAKFGHFSIDSYDKARSIRYECSGNIIRGKSPKTYNTTFSMEPYAILPPSAYKTCWKEPVRK